MIKFIKVLNSRHFLESIAITVRSARIARGTCKYECFFMSYGFLNLTKKEVKIVRVFVNSIFYFFFFWDKFGGTEQIGSKKTDFF